MRTTIPLSRRVSILRKFHHGHGRLPTARELIALYGFTSTRSATYHYGQLEDAGFVRKNGPGYVPTPALTALPYYESIAAGIPAAADGTPTEFLEIERWLVRKPDATFLVKVQGDSMRDAGILDGDIVVVERCRTAKDGEMVIALVDDEWTLKYLARKGGQVYLKAANPKYRDIRPKVSLSVEGVVRGVVRRVGES